MEVLFIFRRVWASLLVLAPEAAEGAEAIKKLRHALGDRAGCIRTIVKVGYKFQEEKYE